MPPRVAPVVHRLMAANVTANPAGSFALAEGRDRRLYGAPLAPNGEADDAEQDQGGTADERSPPGIERREPAVHLRFEADPAGGRGAAGNPKLSLIHI